MSHWEIDEHNTSTQQIFVYLWMIPVLINWMITDDLQFVSLVIIPRGQFIIGNKWELSVLFMIDCYGQSMITDICGLFISYPLVN